MSTVTIDLDDLDNLFEGGFKRVMKTFGDEVQEAFGEDVWAWPNVTRRRNLTTVGSPRDVIDLGNLQGSQTPPVVTGDTGYIEWTADHAVKVFTGLTDRGRNTQLARNVPDMVARRFNFADQFLREVGFL